MWIGFKYVKDLLPTFTPKYMTSDVFRYRIIDSFNIKIIDYNDSYVMKISIDQVCYIFKYTDIINEELYCLIYCKQNHIYICHRTISNYTAVNWFKEESTTMINGSLLKLRNANFFNKNIKYTQLLQLKDDYTCHVKS